MGVFGRYSGAISIPEEKREIFSEYMGKILNFGGMVKFTTASLYGYEIALMEPVEVHPGECVRFHYNYFEDDGWETAYYDDETSVLFSQKLGSAEFDNVIMAGYMLYEYFCEGNGLADLNGDIIDTVQYTAWLNGLLGTEYSMEQRFRLWDLAEGYAMENLGQNDDSDILPNRIIWEIIPWDLMHASGGTDLADLFFLTDGTKDLESEDILPGTYPDDIRKARYALESFFRRSEDDAPEERIWELLRMKRRRRVNIHEQVHAGIVAISLILPARVIVYLTAELRGFSFWKTWAKLKDSVYHDERMRRYAPPEVEAERERIRKAPVPPIRTSDFLRQEGAFTFWDTPEELKDEPNYYISDDDRLYWWDGSDEVRISDAMDKWLKGLAKRHREIMADEKGEITEENFLEKFLCILDDAEKHYKRIFAFGTMFYEFLQNSYKKEYRAALELFRELVEENREEGEIIRYVGNYWDLTSKNVTHNIARLRLKRYLSIMANPALRKKYFDF